MRVGRCTAFPSMVRGGSKIRVMRALRFHSNLLATPAVLVLISVPAVSLHSGFFVGTVTDRFQKPVPTAVVTLSSIDQVYRHTFRLTGNSTLKTYRQVSTIWKQKLTDLWVRELPLIFRMRIFERESSTSGNCSSASDELAGHRGMRSPGFNCLFLL